MASNRFRSGSALSLGTRLGSTLALAIALMLLASVIWWGHQTRRSIEEEVRAASHVAQQWLVVLIGETQPDANEGATRLMAHLRAVGRIRANQLEVVAEDGSTVYLSPESTYKSGRYAPDWFAGWISPSLPAREFPVGERKILLRPDSSRSVLDAWDDIRAAAGTALALLMIATFSARAALNRALKPLAEIHEALSRGANGRFDLRLPHYGVAELDRVAASYNRLADALDQSRAQNHRLEEDQAFVRRLQARIEQERQLIARELHDELAQAITAVRAISGALMQRSEDEPQVYGSAQAILAMTGQMQDGVRNILQRLRSSADPAGEVGEEVLAYCRLWSRNYPHITIESHAAANAPATGERVRSAVLRLLQESLTNVARHSGASRVGVRLEFTDETLVLEVRDDGCGLGETEKRGHYGLVGMRERVAELQGALQLHTPPGGGLRVRAYLPLSPSREESTDGLCA